jgi:uncharacterized membrane protein YphA (DoxX/SURF4 family)
MTAARAGLLRRGVGHLARVALGLIFIAAGLLKAADPAEFAHQMAGYGLVGPAVTAVAAPLLIAFETMLGAALLFGVLPQLGGLLAAALLLSFIAVEIYGLSIGRTESCGCFGTYVQRTPAQVIGEDVVFLALALLAVWGLRGWRPRHPVRRAALVLIAAVAALALAVASPRLPLDGLVTRLAEGRTVDDLGLGATVPELRHGRHLVALLDLDGPHASGTVERLNAIAATPGAPAVLGLTPASEEEAGAFFWAASPSFPIRAIDRPILKRLYRRLPRFFLVQEGRVAAIYDQTVPRAADLLSSGPP